ncbi:hypothetical protein BVRB_3g059740 [Beta vulgaris subsp. vulgaris]|uniref:Uncharacterized protein n=1 Tax=Beta vulgaris subsp. vulgaris TaxID=3555 RepID=A0A0J8FHT6_BETVV|nr:hypothetical protein BVRB_3g059740 [Beta vulgaris subsp. vulgaris]
MEMGQNQQSSSQQQDQLQQQQLQQDLENGGISDRPDDVAVFHTYFCR